MDYFHKDGGKNPKVVDQLQIAVIGESSPANPEHRGLLKSFSPEECRHALILSIASAIESGAADEELAAWRQRVLSMTTVFTKFDTEEEIFWAATNFREAIGAAYEVVYYSSVRPPDTVSAVTVYVVNRQSSIVNDLLFLPLVMPRSNASSSLPRISPSKSPLASR